MEEGSGSSIWHRLSKIFSSSSLDSVEQAIREARQDGELDQEEGSMLLNVLSLDDMQVQDIMTPRTDIVCIKNDATINELIELIISSGHSRIPVYKENKDNIVGIIYAKDILQYSSEEKNTLKADAIMRDAFFVPETKKVLELLQEFKGRKLHISVILDEYGGTAGIVTIEDVIEVILGDIEDEHDAPRIEEIRQQTDGSYLVAGRTDLEDLAEKLPVKIASDEVDTIGGYLSLISGRVPKAGDTFVVGSAKFSVVDADAKQIHTLKIELPEPETINASETTV